MSGRAKPTPPAPHMSTASVRLGSRPTAGRRPARYARITGAPGETVENQKAELPAVSDPKPHDLAPLPALDGDVVERLPPDRQPVLVYLARLAPGSRRTMRGALETVAREVGFPSADTLPWHRLRYQHAAALRSRFAARFAPSTTNKILAALRGVLRECMRLGLMSAEDHARAVDVDGVRGHRVPRGRSLDAGEIRTLFESCDPTTPLGARDAAILALGYGCGLRRAEIAGLDLADLRDDGELLVRGKGSKERTAHLAGGAAAALDAWLVFRGDAPGPLLLPVEKGGRVQDRRMSIQGVYDAIVARAERAGVARFSPHDFRRTHIGDLLDLGADIATVSGMVGHASVTTTARYDRRGERAKKRAAELLHVPFRGRADSGAS